EKVTRSLEKIEQAAQLVEERPGDALTLSASAFYATPGVVSIRRGLLTNLKHYPHLKSLVHSNNTPIISVASALNGRLIAFVNNNYETTLGQNTVSFYDNETKRILRNIPLGET